MRVGDRVIGLAVESIIGVREFERTTLSEVPPLLLQAHPQVLTSIGLLDGELMQVLDGARIIAEERTSGRLENFPMRSTPEIGNAQVARFGELIEERLGLRLDLQYLGSSLDELQTIVAARMRVLQCRSFESYMERFKSSSGSHDELRALASELTIGETYFFRSPEQLSAFSEVALPRLIRTDHARPIRILSAGCSTGEEPFTLAMTLRELGPLAPADVSILAIDINPEALAKARRGRYSAWAMRATPPECVEKYFHRERSQFALDERVQAMVRLEERSLAVEDDQFWHPHSFDIIFCRNVIMYLSARVVREVIARFARVLAPDGFLFLSHAEPLRGTSQAFHVEYAEGALLLRAAQHRRTAHPDELGHLAGKPAQRRWLNRYARYLTTSWPPQSFRLCLSAKESISRSTSTASFAIAGPAIAESDLPSPDEASPPGKGPSLSLGAALMKAEQYDEALATLQALAPADRLDPDVLLLKAIIQVERGKLDEAAELCALLLSQDGLNAAMRY